MKKIIFFVVTVAVLVSCESSVEVTHSYPLSTVMVNEFELELDSVTGFYSPFIQYKKEGASEYLYTVNINAQTIFKYDLNSGEILKRVNYKLEGPEGIGKRLDCFLVQSDDSVYVLDGWTGRVSLIDDRGDLLGKYNLAPNGANTGYPYPIGDPSTPLTIRGENLVVAGMVILIPGGENIERPFIEYSIVNDSIQYLLERPDINNKFNWGGPAMNFVFYDYDSRSDHFYISFSNYENLIVSDLKDYKAEIHTPSHHFDELAPYSKNPKKSPNGDELFRYYATTPRYYGVHFDPYRNLIYRFTEYPNEHEEFQPGVMNNKMSVIVVDANTHEVVGEFDFDKDAYDFRMVFVSQEGLNLASKHRFSENEDALVFHTYVINHEQK